MIRSPGFRRNPGSLFSQSRLKKDPSKGTSSCWYWAAKRREPSCNFRSCKASRGARIADKLTVARLDDYYSAVPQSASQGSPSWSPSMVCSPHCRR